ncbi:MAG: pre-peptidase C-terminal domain-containing protein [Thermoplasmata archaeon]
MNTRVLGVALLAMVLIFGGFGSLIYGKNEIKLFSGQESGRVVSESLSSRQSPDVEPNENFTNASTITLGNYTGLTAGPEFYEVEDSEQDTYYITDMYKIMLEPCSLYIVLTHPTTSYEDLDLHLFDSQYNLLESSMNWDPPEYINISITSAGWYYIGIEYWSYDWDNDEYIVHSYTLSIYTGEPPQPPQDDEFEENDEFNASKWIEPGTYSLVCLDDDWFKFNATAGQNINVTIYYNYSLGDLDLYLYYANGTEIDYSLTTEDYEIIEYTPTQSGVYYILVEQYRGASNYTLILSLGGQSAGNIILLGGSCSPSPATVGQDVTFSITYKHQQGTAPTLKRVYIDDNPYTMQSDPNSTNYVTGVLFTYTTNTLTSGDHSYYFEFTADTETKRFPSTGTLTLRVNNQSSQNSPPELTNPGVAPETGNESTLFLFSIEYSDPDNDPAQYVKVVINGQEYSMTNQAGALYTYSSTFSAGTYTYKFKASDGQAVVETAENTFTVTGGQSGGHTAIRVTINANKTSVYAGEYVDIYGTVVYEDNTPVEGATVEVLQTTYTTNASGGYRFSLRIMTDMTLQANATKGSLTNSSGTLTISVIGTNKPPILSGAGVTPTSGNTSTTFNFTVTYTDEDNDPAAYVKVIINQQEYLMVTLDGSHYWYSAQFPAGTYNLSGFKAHDGTVETSLPFQTTITVEAAPSNSPPQLSEPSVSPTAGDANTNFTFRVKYTDADGDTPTYVKVVIGTNTYNMSLNGAYYEYKTTLTSGNYTYSFKANDGHNPEVSISGGQLNVSSPPPQNTAPKLLNLTVTPESGDTNTEFTFSVTYQDDEGDAPASGVKITIGNNTYTMSTNDTELNYTKGVIYTYKTKLPEGSHNVTVSAGDSSHASTPTNTSRATPVAVSNAATGGDDGSSPGFGLIPALVAIAAAVLIAGRRIRRKN